MWRLSRIIHCFYYIFCINLEFSLSGTAHAKNNRSHSGWRHARLCRKNLVQEIGDFPLMTERGTFIINGTERVVVSQLVRSPGVYFERVADKTSDKDVFSTKVIPSQ